MAAGTGGWLRVAVDVERTLVVHQADRRRLLVGVVLFPILAAFQAALTYGSARFVCEREADGAMACSIETDGAFEAQHVRLSLRDPTITVIAATDRGGSGELRIVDGETTFTAAGPTSVLVDLGRELEVCLGDTSRIRCAAHHSNASGCVIHAGVLTSFVLVFLLAISGTRTLLIANRERRELRVVRRLFFFPRKAIVLPSVGLDAAVQRVEGRRGPVWSIALQHEGSTAVRVGGARDETTARERLVEVRALLAWLSEGEAPRPEAIESPSAWDPTTNTLRPGLVPVHEVEARASRNSVFGSALLAACVFGLIVVATSVVSPGVGLTLAAVFAVLLAPVAYFVRRLDVRARERAEANLVVETKGVWRTKDGGRRLVAWSEIASVEERVLGRYTFRDAAGTTLFSVLTVGDDDAKMAKVMIAAAEAGVLSATGSTASVTIGAPAVWAIAIVGGPLFALFGLGMLVIPSLSRAPHLEDLEHRSGVVAEFDRVMSSSGTVRFELEHDDFAFYVVRGRDHAEAVLDTLSVGDEVEIWHDRAERSFGAIGAVFQMRVGEQMLFAWDEASVEQADAADDRKRSTGLVLATSGFAAWALGMLAQRRRAIVTVRGPR